MEFAEGCAYSSRASGSSRIFFRLNLGSADLVLGVTWLKTLGEARVDWAKFTMKFQRDGEWISWTGDPSLSRSSISLLSLTRSWSPWEIGVLLELCSMEAGTLDSATPPTNAHCEKLIHEFCEVFDTPKGLPPRQAREHKIVL